MAARRARRRCRRPTGRRSRTARRTPGRTHAAGADGVPSQSTVRSRPRRPSPNGWRRPSLPGLRIPFGSSASFTAAARRAGAERLGHEPGAVEADAVVVREVAAAGEHGALAGVPQRDVRRLDLVGRRGGGEREVEAGAVGVAVRQVAAGDAGVGHGRAARRGPRRRSPAGAPTARRSPSCRRRSPCGSSACRAEVSLRWASQRSTSASSPASPAAGALVGDDRHRRVDDRRVALVEHEQHVHRVPSPPWPRWRLDRVVQAQHRRRGAAPQDPAAGLDPSANESNAVRGAALGGRDRDGRAATPG